MTIITEPLLNKSLDQKVDVVNCLWFDNADSVKNDKRYPYRGVKIFDKSKNSWMTEDFPFIKIDLMNKRDKVTNGHYKEMIRLIKTLKTDVGGCDELSSFDIYSVKQIQMSTNHRSRPLFVATKANSEDYVDAFDLPTTLSGVDKAIDMFLRRGYVGKTKRQKLLEDRELNNFRRVLELLIKENAYARKCVVVISEKDEIPVD